jgi:hypothetical protein
MPRPAPKTLKEKPTKTEGKSGINLGFRSINVKIKNIFIRKYGKIPKKTYLAQAILIILKRK